MNIQQLRSKLSAGIRRQRDQLRELYHLVRKEIRAVEDPAPVEQRDLNYVASATQAVLLQNPKGARLIVWTTFWFFFLAILWASFASVDEFTRAGGKIVPSRHLQVVQNLEGGILAELYVSEGAEVTVGQPLLRIDDTLFSSSFREQAQHVHQLKVQLQRLQAESRGEIFSVPKGEFEFPEIYEQEERLFKSRSREFKAKEEQLARSFNLVSQELEMMRPLLKEGAISEVEVLRLERQANDLSGELKTTRLSIQSQIHQELNEVAAEYARYNETLTALEDRVDRTIVRSPVTGRVNQIRVKTIGGVIQPGMDILDVVPTGDRLLIEARVSPVDIAFLHPGQKAVVKVTAYDFAIHGGLEGELVHISPDTLVDAEGNSYYSIKVETEKSFLGPTAEDSLPIIPGMTVEAEILTGRKTIMRYLLNPLLRARDRAFSER